MITLPTFHSVFADRLTQYLTMRTQIGIRDTKHWRYLRDFDQYVSTHPEITRLTQEIAIAIACLHPTHSETLRASRYAAIRQFADFLIGLDPTMTPLDPNALHVLRHRPPADILTWEQIEALMQAAAGISPRHPIIGYTLRVMIGLAACTGMRVSEITRLNRDDVDTHAGVIHIRQTKFAKSRLVPVLPETMDALLQYARVRDVTYPTPGDPAFFLNLAARRLDKSTIDSGFLVAARACGLRAAEGPGPHFHSLRHTYAVRCLERWYREGREIMSLLPVLATYMGHACYTNTAYYITAVPELLALAAERRDATDWFAEMEATP